MTPSEKAIELVDYFMGQIDHLQTSKRCAIKVCEEIINTHYENPIEIDFQTKIIEEIKAIYPRLMYTN